MPSPHTVIVINLRTDNQSLAECRYMVKNVAKFLSIESLNVYTENEYRTRSVKSYYGRSANPVKYINL